MFKKNYFRHEYYNYIIYLVNCLRNLVEIIISLFRLLSIHIIILYDYRNT